MLSLRRKRGPPMAHRAYSDFAHLRDNQLRDGELCALCADVAASETITKLNLAGNALSAPSVQKPRSTRPGSPRIPSLLIEAG